MRPENIGNFVAELGREYSGAIRLREGEKTLVRLPNVFFPDGCNPSNTEALVILEEAQATPQLLVKQLPTLTNGREPRSVSSVTAVGEAWHSFSFNQPWNEDTHSAMQFVEGRLRRFALNE